MFNKIKNFFKSDLFKNSLKLVFDIFIMFLGLCFLFGFLVNCIYFGIKLAEVVPPSFEIIEIFSGLIFS